MRHLHDLEKTNQQNSWLWLPRCLVLKLFFRLSYFAYFINLLIYAFIFFSKHVFEVPMAFCASQERTASAQDRKDMAECPPNCYNARDKLTCGSDGNIYTSECQLKLLNCGWLLLIQYYFCYYSDVVIGICSYILSFIFLCQIRDEKESF